MPGILDAFAAVDSPIAEGYIGPYKPRNVQLPPGTLATSRALSEGLEEMTDLCFQYWPSEIKDSRDIGWKFRDIPGGSDPIVYWSSGGQRTISFTAEFSRDVDNDFTVLDLVNLNVPEAQITQKERNPDLRAVAKWLRWYTYPRYDAAGGSPIPPPSMIIVFPGLQLGWDGDDSLICVMTQCDFSYSDFFPSGAPKRLTAELAFVEIIQKDGGVYFNGRDDSLTNTDRARGPGDYTVKPRGKLVAKSR